ncbi:MAG TPA: ROK family protein [Dehalococcoidia bacterium]|nr:ROK family protein [Dehalococcoidia bacterium]
MGVDLGATKVLALVARATGEVLASCRRPTDAHEGPAAVVQRIVECAREALDEAGVTMDRIAGVGAMAAGPLDLARGVITTPPNLPGWRDVPLRDLLSAAFGLPVLLENDANAQGYGEYRFGAGRGARNLLFVTVSTGIGGGIVLDGRVYHGASGAAGEVGHVPLDPDGPPCGAGHPGDLEAMASGLAIAREAEAALHRGECSVLRRLAAEGREVTAETVAEAASLGDSDAAAIIQRAGRWLGMGLAGLVNVLNPDTLVLGGGLTNLGDAYLTPAREELQRRAFPQAFADLRVAVGSLGERAGALGAVALVAEQSGES